MSRAARFALAAGLVLAVAAPATAGVRLGRSGVFKGRGDELVQKIETAATHYVEPERVAASLTASLAFSCGTAFVGGPLDARLVVTNTGNGRAAGVTPSIAITAGSSLVSHQSGPVPADVVVLAGGTSVTFVWTYTVLAAGTIQFAASVVGQYARNGDPLSAQAANGVPALDVGQLVSRLSRAPATGLITKTVDLRITVTNTGTAPVSDVLPGLWVTSGDALVDSGSGPVPSGPVTLAAKASQTFTWTFNVLAEGSVGITATATGLDSGLGIPIDTVTTTVLPTLPGGRPVPAVELGGAWLIAGDVQAVGLVVQNTGGDKITNTVPALSVVGGTASGIPMSGPVPAGPLTIMPGGTTTFVWTYTFSGLGTVVFSGTVSGIDALIAMPVSAQVSKAGQVCYRISTVAGVAGNPGDNPDGLPATSSRLYSPRGMATDAAGNLFIASIYADKVKRVDKVTGVMTTVAGDGSHGFSGDGGPATSAALNSPRNVVVDASGTIYIVEVGNGRVRKVEATTWTISTVAGGGLGGDGVSATCASLSSPEGIAVDPAGNIFISEYGRSKIRKVDAATGLISTYAGGGAAQPKGVPATSASIGSPFGLALDAAGNLYIANGFSILKVTQGTGIIDELISGNGGAPYEGMPASSARSITPRGVAVDPAGNVFFAESTWESSSTKGMRVRRMDAGGLVWSFAGRGDTGFGGDGGAGPLAWLNAPEGIYVDAAGNVYVADGDNHVIRKLGP